MPTFLYYAQQFINILAAVIPNHKQILYQMAMIKYLSGEIRTAANLVNRCLQYDGKFIDLFILMAKISIHDRNFKTANQCLENALVLDFKVCLFVFRFTDFSEFHLNFRYVMTFPTYCPNH